MAGSAIAGVLERVGIIDRRRLQSTVDLAWPRIITGFAIMSKSTVDLAMVGIAVGTPAVAGLAFANAYWQLAKFAGIGLAGGVVTLISQAYGAENIPRARSVLVAGLLFATAVGLPVVLAYVLFAGPLIGLFGPTEAIQGYGRTYLLLVAPGLLFEFWNLIASRTYAGVGNTLTPMAIRATGALANVVLSAALIFGAGLGVAGAAIGTAASVAIVSLVFAWGLSGRSYFGRGACPVAIRRAAGLPDRRLLRELFTVSAPLVARRSAESIVAFPLLAIAASFGSVVVAAYEVGRRVRALVDSFSWGFSIAASTFVGQRLGAGDEADAEAYGWAIIRLSATVYVIVATGVALLSRPIAGLFVDTPDAIAQTAVFVVAAAASVIFLGLDGSATGTLRGAGDTRFPFVSSLVGRYGFGLTVAAAGTMTAFGAQALLVAMVLETMVPAALNLSRVRSNRWKRISRGYRESLGD